jgi:hypothetical protein
VCAGGGMNRLKNDIKGRDNFFVITLEGGGGGGGVTEKGMD